MRLSLVFSEDSWAEITDATGRRILYGLQRAGARREMSGEPPVVVFLGNASGVEVLVDGSEYPISSGARRGNTARFEIQPEIQP
jgi:cytoskeleton protein RodZ